MPMTWAKNQHGGFHNEDNSFYIGQTPKRFYQVFRQVDGVWSLLTFKGFAHPEDAKAYAEGLVEL